MEWFRFDGNAYILFLLQLLRKAMTRAKCCPVACYANKTDAYKYPQLCTHIHCLHCFMRRLQASTKWIDSSDWYRWWYGEQFNQWVWQADERGPFLHQWWVSIPCVAASEHRSGRWLLVKTISSSVPSASINRNLGIAINESTDLADAAAFQFQSMSCNVSFVGTFKHAWINAYKRAFASSGAGVFLARTVEHNRKGHHKSNGQ